MTHRWGLALGVVLVAAGCVENSSPVSSPVAAPVPEFVAADVDAVARAFAAGMAQPEVRASVRDAMRASRLTDHKVSLREFAVNAAGEQLLRAAAGAAGTGLAELRSKIATFPDLDFYVPIRQQRLTWRATGDYVIAVSLGGQAPSVGYDAGGAPVALDFTQSEPPSQVVFMLQSAESKSPRIAAQPDGPGLTIQDPGDGQISGSLTMTDRNGVTHTIYLADMRDPGVVVPMTECPPEVIYCEPDPGPPPPPPPPPTYLEYITTDGVHDNNVPWETNEFEVRAVLPDGSTNVIRVEGVSANGPNYIHRVLINGFPPMKIAADDDHASIRETDAWPNPDDLFKYWDNAAQRCAYLPIPGGPSPGTAGGALSDGTCANPQTVWISVVW